MMSKSKQQWVDEVLDSLGSIERAPAPPDLLEKIGSKRTEKKLLHTSTVSMHLWKVAAAILILFGLNLYVLKYKINQQKMREYQGLVKELGLEKENYDL